MSNIVKCYYFWILWIFRYLVWTSVTCWAIKIVLRIFMNKIPDSRRYCPRSQRLDLVSCQSWNGILDGRRVTQWFILDDVKHLDWLPLRPGDEFRRDLDLCFWSVRTWGVGGVGGATTMTGLGRFISSSSWLEKITDEVTRMS